MIRLVIKDLALERGIKQYQLAELSGVTPQLLNRYWNNHTQRVELAQLAKIAKALGVQPGDLMILEEAKTEEAA